MTIKHSLLFSLAVTINTQLFAQPSEVHSGILHTATNNEESNLLKLHCVDLNSGIIAKLIQDEFSKYSEQITSFEIRVPERKIYIKYNNTIQPNMILGILERVALKAYYLDGNQSEIYFVKTGSENFKR